MGELNARMHGKRMPTMRVWLAYETAGKVHSRPLLIKQHQNEGGRIWVQNTATSFAGKSMGTRKLEQAENLWSLVDILFPLFPFLALSPLLLWHFPAPGHHSASRV